MLLSNVTALLPTAFWGVLLDGVSSYAQSVLGLSNTLDVTSTPLCPGRPATAAQQKAILNSFLQTFLIEQDPRTAFSRHVSEDYIQHNPDVGQGNLAAAEMLGPIFDEGVDAEIRRIIMADSHAAVHLRVKEARRDHVLAIMDIYRFDGTCIVEHWDVLQEVSTTPMNELGMF